MRLLIVLFATSFSAVSGCAPATQPTRFHARNVTVVEALLTLGRQYRICFAIEGLDSARRVTLDARDQPAAEAIKRILASTHATSAIGPDGIVSIRNSRQTPRQWLDRKIPRFKTPRGPLQEINNSVHIALTFQMRPGLKGIAGHYSPGTAGTHAGPFDEKNKTVRQLLNRLLAGTPNGGLWIVRSANPSEPIWTLIDYAEPAEASAAILNTIASARMEK